MQTYKVEPATGLYLEDVIHPDTVWVPGLPDDEGQPTLVEIPFPVPSDEVIEPVPGGFWHPRWDGSKWVEGLSPSEIKARQPAPLPDYTRFIVALSDNKNPMKGLLGTTSDQLALTSIIIELHAPEPRFEMLKLHWDNIVEGLPQPLTATQKKGFEKLATSANLNMSLDENGNLIQN